MRIEDELTRWALAVDLPKSRQIGADRVGRILVALVQYAGSDLTCWPSRATLAADVSGVSERDVRNALDALVDVGLIARDGRQGRNARWRIVADLAGMPANTDREPGGDARQVDMAGMPAISTADLAGNMAGNMAGIPAANQNQNRMHAAEPSAQDYERLAAELDELAPGGVLLDQSVPPTVGKQLADVRAAALAALAGVILDQPHGSYLDGRDAWASRLREAGWSPVELASEFRRHPIVNARGAGVLRDRLAELVTRGAPALAAPDRGTPTATCPDHGTALAATGTCASCSADHHDPEALHLSAPRSTCRRCADAQRFAA